MSIRKKLLRKLALWIYPDFADEISYTRSRLADAVRWNAALENSCDPNMSMDDARKIIEDAKRWNTGQESVSRAFGGPRTDEDDVLDMRRLALRKAWALMAGVQSKGVDHADTK